MDREQAKALLPIIKAFSEGKTIQCLTGSGEWYDVVGNDTIDFEILADRKTKYRIKPEPKYRSFRNAEECWNEMKKHKPFGWIKCKEGYFNIVYVNNFYVGLADNDGSRILLASKNSYQDNTFADGTPFGIRENF